MGLSLADDEGELKVYFVVVCELQEKTRGSVYRLGILINGCISFEAPTLHRMLCATNLDKFDGRRVSL